MRIESVTLLDVQRAWETNRRYSGATRSPEMIALIEALSKMNIGEAKAIKYGRGRNPSERQVAGTEGGEEHR